MSVCGGLGRRAWFAAAAVALVTATLFGCISRPEHNDARRWARAWIDSLNSRSLEQLLPLFGSAGTYEAPGTGGPLSGMKLGAYFLNGINYWSLFTVRLTTVTAGDGNQVIFEWVAKGVPAGHQTEVHFDGVTILEHHDGRITRARSYFDATVFLQFIARGS